VEGRLMIDCLNHDLLDFGMTLIADGDCLVAMTDTEACPTSRPGVPAWQLPGRSGVSA